MAVEERKERSDKRIRVNAGLSQDDHTKLERLAFATRMPKTILAAELIHFCLNNEHMIEYIQKRYKAPDDRRIIPIISNGKITCS
jgi:hypothetical protein